MEPDLAEDGDAALGGGRAGDGECVMRTIERTQRFKRDYKRENRTDPSLDDVLAPALEMLVSGAALPERMRDHALGGDWKGYRDCHLRPDLVFIYARSEKVVQLVRLGSHAELFG